jgi:hypothetical protein
MKEFLSYNIPVWLYLMVVLGLYMAVIRRTDSR